MGFLRRLFGPKRPTTSPPAKDKKRWGFACAKDKAQTKSHSAWPAPSPDISSSSSSSASASAALDANKHAIAVAAATAAVAEAALAAAHAAAEVVRLTNSGAGAAAHVSRSRFLAAVKIQSAFRGYLARRALRALKALVKLQALVRGNIVRKQTADMLRRMQTLVRVQARARASRTTASESLHSCGKNSLPNHPFPENAGTNRHQQRAYSSKYDGPSILKRCGSNTNFRDVLNLDKTKTGSNWLDRWMEESVWNNCQGTSTRYANADHDEKSDKILEVDTWKPHLDPQRSTRSFQMPRHVLASDYHNQSFATFDSPSKRSTKATKPTPNPSSLDAFSLSHLKYPIEKDEATLRSSGSSPQPFSASSRPGSNSARRGPFTPAKSDRSWGYFSAYSGYPNYMANTESSRAKVRSQSAPKQRLEFEKHSASKRSAQGYWDGWTHSDSNIIPDADLRSSAYPSSNHMDRFGSASLR